MKNMRPTSWLLTKKFRFESAHRIAKGYVGKCSNIHGHSWNGEVQIECTELNSHSFGMDYSEIGEFTRSIEAALDHQLLLFEGDQELLDLCSKNHWAVVSFSENPSSEVIAQWIFERAEKWFAEKNGAIQVKSVAIEETCTTRCVYLNPLSSAAHID